MKLLIISFAFPPFNSIGAVRVGKTAKYLTELGHDVRVVTARDQPFPSTLQVEVDSDDVVYTKWLNLRGPVKVVLQESGVASGTDSPNGQLTNILKKTLGRAYRTLFYFPDPYIGWLPKAVSASTDMIKSWRPDIILASSPPPTSLLVAARLSRIHNIPWVADLRDLWVDHQYYQQPGWRRFFETKMERRVLSSAADFITVSDPLAETLRDKYGKPTAVVLNGFDPSDYPTGSSVPFNDGCLRILYTGVVYEGKQDPTALFEALRRLGPLAEKIRVVFHGIYLNSVREMIKRYNAQGIVEVNNLVPYTDSLKLQTEADILLLLLWTDQSQRGVYTGKLFEYIGARRPILAIGPPGNVAAEMILKKEAGVVTSDPEEIASLLRNWLEEKRNLGAVPGLPDEVVAGISRKEQVRVLEQRLMKVWADMSRH